jgi:hypothetical protein
MKTIQCIKKILPLVVLGASPLFGQQTTGTIMKFGSPTTTYVNSNIIETNGNIGIGLTPGARLDVISGCLGTDPNNNNILKPAFRVTQTTPGSGGQLCLPGYGDLALFRKQISGGATYRTDLVIKTSGYVGIGTATPQTIFTVHPGTDLNANITADGTTGILMNARNDANTSYMGMKFSASQFTFTNGILTSEQPVICKQAIHISEEGGSGTDHNLHIQEDFTTPNGMMLNATNDAGTAHVGLTLAASKFYFHNGAVKVGAQAPTGIHADYKLSVDGKMIAKEIYVVASGGWADYVFEKDYPLMSLDSLEEFVYTNKHLPNVPSEQEIKETGINTANTDKILLEKVEELTLYIIELNKRMGALEEENAALKNRGK